jgi:hypothetical protein
MRLVPHLFYADPRRLGMIAETLLQVLSKICSSSEFPRQKHVRTRVCATSLLIKKETA